MLKNSHNSTSPLPVKANMPKNSHNSTPPRPVLLLRQHARNLVDGTCLPWALASRLSRLHCLVGLLQWIKWCFLRLSCHYSQFFWVCCQKRSKTFTWKPTKPAFTKEDGFFFLALDYQLSFPCIVLNDSVCFFMVHRITFPMRLN